MGLFVIAGTLIFGLVQFFCIINQKELEEELEPIVMDEEEARLTAIHEAGHALVAYTVGLIVTCANIIPEGIRFGVTNIAPPLGKCNKSQILGHIAALMGGRAAEEVMLGQNNVYQGAKQDIEEATEIIQNMICQDGMSGKLGFINYFKLEFISEKAEEDICQEIRRIADEQYDLAKKIILNDRYHLDKITEYLLREKVINRDQLAKIMKREPKS